MKKLIGGPILVVGLVVYSLIVMTIGQIRFVNAGPGTQLAFFAVAGLVWIVPAGLLIRWMERVDKAE